MNHLKIYTVFQEERSVFYDVTISVIVSEKLT